MTILATHTSTQFCTHVSASASRTISASPSTVAGTLRAHGPAVAAALLLATVLGSSSAPAAERASKSESVGVATGLAVGAAAGGPFGAVIGAATGAWLGDRHHRQQQSIQGLEESVATLERGATRVHGVVHFRTGETGVRPADRPRLEQLAAWLSAYDGIRVRVIGYADPRGSAELNLSLSRERAESVARVLEAAGLDPARVTIEARGAERVATPELGLDDYAFERRVQIELEPREDVVARMNR